MFISGYSVGTPVTELILHTIYLVCFFPACIVPYVLQLTHVVVVYKVNKRLSISVVFLLIHYQAYKKELENMLMKRTFLSVW